MCQRQCQCVSQRFFISGLGFFGLLISIGYRADFSLVMTHVAKRSDSHIEDEFFVKCDVYNTSSDWATDWTQSRIQDFHSVYYAFWFIMQVPGGILAARFSPKRLSGIMVLCGSILFIVLPFLAKVHYGFVFLIQGLQGFVEGGLVPAMAGVISAWAPKSQRTILLNIAYSGAYLSPAVGFIAAGMAGCRISWDSIFFIAGGLGVVWSVLWMALVCETPWVCPHISETERALYPAQGHRVAAAGRHVARAIPWSSILTSLPVLAVFVGAFCRNWVFTMLITQQPQYFKDSFNKTTADIGLFSALPPVLMTVVVVAGGFIVDKLFEKNIVGRTAGRKMAQTLGFGTEAVCLLSLYFVKDFRTAMIVLCVGVGFSGFAISGYQVNPLDLSPQYASLITGISRIGTIGSVLSTQVASKVLQGDNTLEQWQKLWLTAGVIHLVGVLLYDLLASGHTQPWDPSQRALVEFLVSPEDGRVLPHCAAAAENTATPQSERDPLLARPGQKKSGWDSSIQGSPRLG